ncbi:uncharacterized protein DUF3564 [Paraburkholderia caballeronis]|uniref:DUF3564 family protein n=1 Tax=Paraburkholderia caballeronis TaxID=416943 RepID=UPI00106522AF|nr:DUF3564 family protein [Paraburkholderia caballeronis]TDV37835.1 uncharacterized protein DUF3564 [Paraburkholderia caballeronis]
MRVSILVNSVDPTACHDYAVVWLDTTRRAWSRQACAGIALPAHGEILDTGNATLLIDADATALLTLGGFAIDAHEQLRSIHGAATWFSLTRGFSVSGAWHLRAVERTAAELRTGRARPPRCGAPLAGHDERR